MECRFGKKRLAELKASITPESYQSPEPLPTPSGKPPYHLDLSNVIPSPPTDQMTFHLTGDVGGIADPNPQQAVADAMEADYTTSALGMLPRFMYIVGDVVYFNGEAVNYYPQFYEPYVHYLGPIFSIPGNHDGSVLDPNTPSLEAFIRNFCSVTPVVTPDANDVERTAMTQPNCYWTLTSPLATFVGLYSNVPEGGYVDQTQTSWFTNELKAAPTDRALIVSVHHPPYSLDQHHAGSMIIRDLLDNAFSQANRIPDIVFSGHVHNYQRFNRDVKDKTLTYVVIGSGGYHNLHLMQTNPDGTPLKVPFKDRADAVTLQSYDVTYGYLIIQVTNKLIRGIYNAVAKTGGVTRGVDTFSVPLKLS